MRTRHALAGLRLSRPYGAETVWPLRRSPVARRVAGTLARLAVGGLVVVAAVTALLVAATGHPLGWSVVGACFALPPLAVLVGAVAALARAAVASGPGWVGLRLVGRWRRIDLARVRSVRTAPGWGGFGAVTGGVVVEDAEGRRVTLTGDLLGGGLGEVVRRGLPADAVIDADAEERLGPPAADA